MNQLADRHRRPVFLQLHQLLSPLDQIAEENNGYYLLSYQSEKPAGKSGFQQVEVKTTNPEFRVKAREGYTYGG